MMPYYGMWRIYSPQTVSVQQGSSRRGFILRTKPCFVQLIGGDLAQGRGKQEMFKVTSSQVQYWQSCSQASLGYKNKRDSGSESKTWKHYINECLLQASVGLSWPNLLCRKIAVQIPEGEEENSKIKCQYLPPSFAGLCVSKRKAWQFYQETDSYKLHLLFLYLKW